MWIIRSEGHVYEIDEVKKLVRWKKGSRGKWIPWQPYMMSWMVPNKRIELTLQIGIEIVFYLPSVRFLYQETIE